MVVLDATVLALRNQYDSRASAAKFGYRPASMLPLGRRADCSTATRRISRTRLVESARSSAPPPPIRRQQTLFHAGIEEKQRRNDESGGRKRREELANAAASRGGERHDDPDETH